MDIKIITGLSGAGKSTVINSLEDLGYYCIDNLPPSLMLHFVELSKNLSQPMAKIALGIDVRSLAYFEDIDVKLAELCRQYPDSEIIYLEASDHALIKRFKETRRSHPLAAARSLIDGINTERGKMAPIKKMASLIIDTSHMTARDLSGHIKRTVLGSDEIKQITLTFKSFGFKKGIPLDADLMFDVRFLPNPYYDETLRPLSGNDKIVSDYVFQWHETRLFYQKLRDMLDFLIPQYVREGKTQITICIGCTGGRHRSVSLVNKLIEDYQQQYITTFVHRDLRES